MTLDAPFARDLIDWRRTRNGAYAPNIADSKNTSSMTIATALLEELGIPRQESTSITDANTGRPLELAVAGALRHGLGSLPSRRFSVSDEETSIGGFRQYAHLNELDRLARRNPELLATLGDDFMIKPDVVVSLPSNTGDEPWLHAVISCMWTIRSDRVQSVRHEFDQLIRHRRGRLPHLVAVTAEPQPTRLASIARGTGEVDAIYHVAFGALDSAMSRLVDAGRVSQAQSDAWNEVVSLGRVRPYKDLVETIAWW